MKGLTPAWLSHEVFGAMCAEASAHAPLETGGVLLGYWASNAALVITAATPAGPKADHSLCAFTPDREHDEGLIFRAFNASGGAQTYLGDWHTHPAGGCSLSGQDRSTLAQIAQAVELTAPYGIMAILAGGPDWSLCVWTGRRKAIWRRGRLQTKRCELKLF